MSIFGAGHEVVTSTTRPAAPTIGQIIFETDTLSYRWYNGTAWEGVTPVGTIQSFAAATAPSGWEFCNGTILNSVADTKYAALFVAIGTTYGGSGASSFNVPNLAGRIPVGAGTGAQQGTASSGVITGGTALAARTRGQFFGDERTELHTHTQNSHNHTQDSHNHTQNSHDHGGSTGYVNWHNSTWGPAYIQATGSRGGWPGVGWGIWAEADGYRHTHSISAQTATNQAQTATNQAQTATNQNTFAGTGANLQPSVVTNYIIKI